MRYVIDLRNNKVLFVGSSPYSTARFAIMASADRDRARRVYAERGRDIPEKFNYKLATVETSTIRNPGDFLLPEEFTVIVSEK